jgi:hypothetical protein
MAGLLEAIDMDDFGRCADASPASGGVSMWKRDDGDMDLDDAMAVDHDEEEEEEEEEEDDDGDDDDDEDADEDEQGDEDETGHAPAGMQNGHGGTTAAGAAPLTSLDHALMGGTRLGTGAELPAEGGIRVFQAPPGALVTELGSTFQTRALGIALGGHVPPRDHWLAPPASDEAMRPVLAALAYAFGGITRPLRLDTLLRARRFVANVLADAPLGPMLCEDKSVAAGKAYPLSITEWAQLAPPRADVLGRLRGLRRGDATTAAAATTCVLNGEAIPAGAPVVVYHGTDKRGVTRTVTVRRTGGTEHAALWLWYAERPEALIRDLVARVRAVAAGAADPTALGGAEVAGLTLRVLWLLFTVGQQLSEIK